MKKKARSYSVDFKQEAVRRMAQAATIIGLAKELGIRRKLLYQWRDQFRQGWAGATPRPAAGKRVTDRFPASPQCSRVANRRVRTAAGP